MITGCLCLGNSLLLILLLWGSFLLFIFALFLSFPMKDWGACLWYWPQNSSVKFPGERLFSVGEETLLAISLKDVLQSFDFLFTEESWTIDSFLKTLESTGDEYREGIETSDDDDSKDSDETEEDLAFLQESELGETSREDTLNDRVLRKLWLDLEGLWICGNISSSSCLLLSFWGNPYILLCIGPSISSSPSGK